MKLKSLNSVLAMTAAFGIAFVGVSCKPADKAGGGAEDKGSAPAKEEHADHKEGEKKDAHADHKAGMKKEAPKAEAPKADAKKEEAPKAK